MKNKFGTVAMKTAFSLVLGFVVLVPWLQVANTQVAFAGEWPQFNGPNRDGVIELGFDLSSIPEEGFKKAWEAPVELGYSGPAVAGGRVFVSDFQKIEGEMNNNPGVRDQLLGRERLNCFDEATGQQLWQYAYDRDYAISYAAGPRATPTVDGDRVFMLGAEGDLSCVMVATGELKWKRQLRDEYGAETPIWGHCASPLVVGDLVYALAGGEGSIVVALDRDSGEERWRALTARAIGYCPPALLRAEQLNGAIAEDQLLIWDSDNLHALDLKSGKVHWTEPLAPKYEMSIAPPLQIGNRLFLSGIGEVAAMFELAKDGQSLETLWRGRARTALYSSNAAPIYHDGYLYGSDCEKGSFMCVSAKDGERVWETFEATTRGDRRASHGTGFITKIGDKAFVFSEIGDLILIQLDPAEYKELGRQKVIEPTNECFGRDVVWSYPAFANRAVYFRNDQKLVRYNLE